MEATKTCPQCQCEYRSSAQICADCGVPLVWSGPAVEPTGFDEGGWDEVPPGEILGTVATDNEKVIRIYLGHLKQAGIQGAVLPLTRYQSRELRFDDSVIFGRVVSGGKAGQIPVGDVLTGFQYILFVRQVDFSRAQEIVDDLFAELHPGQEEGFSREFELGECPACGAAVAEAADECPDCGLSLG